VTLAETKSEYQWLNEPPRNKTVSKYMLTFTFAYKKYGERHRKEGYVVYV